MLLSRFYKLVEKDMDFVDVDYNMIKESGGNLRYAKPCLKRYLFEHVQSRLIPIPLADWDMILRAPLERFVKKDTSTVWADSLRAADKQ